MSESMFGTLTGFLMFESTLIAIFAWLVFYSTITRIGQVSHHIRAIMSDVVDNAIIILDFICACDKAYDEGLTKGREIQRIISSGEKR